MVSPDIVVTFFNCATQPWYIRRVILGPISYQPKAFRRYKRKPRNWCSISPLWIQLASLSLTPEVTTLFVRLQLRSGTRFPWWQVATLHKMLAKWQFINSVLLTISYHDQPFHIHLSPAPIQQRENTHSQGHCPGLRMLDRRTQKHRKNEWVRQTLRQWMNSI